MNNDNYKFGRYVNSKQETRWATVDEIQSASAYLNLGEEDYPTAGLPLLSDGKEAYVDDKDTHSLVFGATGSKKTRLFCMPMINMFAKAGESFVVTDPKGELYAKTSGLVGKKGYKTVVLNFRDIGKGDAWNPLALPYEMYKSGNQDEAISMLNDFVSIIAEPQIKNTKDIFWPEMASSYALANLLLLMEAGDEDEVHIASLTKLCMGNNERHLQFLAKKMDADSIAKINYEGVFGGATNTKKSIYAVLYGMLRVFNTQEKLTQMLSRNTINMRNFGREKTAVYIIIPDEKTTYHFLVTTFIKQVYQVLILEAQKEEDFKLPVRVNFVLDEFCNLPKIADMPSMISAARSRNMRFYLVAQSLHQLRSKYGEDADTIKGNCENWVFLTSKELDLLQEISELCGNIVTTDKNKRRLISVSELQRLDKEKGEALIMYGRQYPFITGLADIDMYECFQGYAPVELKEQELSDVEIFSVFDLFLDVRAGRKACPFGGVQAIEEAESSDSVSERLFDDDLEEEMNEYFSSNKPKKPQS